LRSTADLAEVPATAADSSVPGAPCPVLVDTKKRRELMKRMARQR